MNPSEPALNPPGPSVPPLPIPPAAPPPEEKPSPEDKAKHGLTKLPKVSDPEWRIACNDIVEALSKKTRFRWEVTGTMVGVFLAALLVIISLGGVSAKSYLDEKVAEFKHTADEDLRQARKVANNQIKAQFETPVIRQVVAEVAGDQSSKLLTESVQPKIMDFRAEIEKRLVDFDEFLKSQKNAASKDVEEVRAELAKLKSRNELTALADDAISNGNVEAYHELEKIEHEKGADAGAMAELLRVFETYSPFAPVRWADTKLNASVINPKKNTEEELEIRELMPVLILVPAPQARARAAILINQKAKVGSYSAAMGVISAIQVEKHLEVLKRLREAFNRITGYDKGGRLDGSELVEWWKEHQAELKAKDTDAPAKP